MATILGLGYIYRYLLDGKTVYVGQTKDLDKRVQAHSQETRFFGLTDIQFKGCLVEHLNNVEAYFIDKYNPILNRVHPKIKDENIEEVINKLFDWETYQKPIPVIYPLVNFTDIERAFTSFKNNKEIAGTCYYGFGIPLDPEIFPTSIDYYTFGTGKSRFECILLEDYNKCMIKIRNNFLQMVSEKAYEIAEDLVKHKRIK